MTYAELKPGDVFVRDGRPLYVVIRCSRDDNEFAWLPLNGDRAGHLIEPDLARIEMWDVNVSDTFDATTIVRGS